MTIDVDLCVNWERVGECDGGTFDAVIRHLRSGEWTLTGHAADVELAGGVTLDQVDTIRVVQDTDVIFAGTVGPVSSGVGGYSTSDDGNGEVFTLAGPDLWGLLATRIAYPTPATDPPWTDDHDVRSGVASTVAAGYVRDNMGSTALVARQIAGLSIIDGLVGAVGTWSARLQPLDQLIARVCTDGGITCRPTLTFGGVVTVTFANPRNRATTVILSDQGDLSQIQQSRQPATATYVIAGGQGELAARTFAVAGTASGADRVETFYDVSALAGAAEVQQAATSKLGQSAETLAVQAQLVDYATKKVTFLVDYDIGDTIAVEIDAVRYPVLVDSVTIHRDAERSLVRPVLGGSTFNALSGLISDVAGLTARFDTNIA